MSNLKVSVVICTHNRSQDLAACLAALSVQQAPGFEYIVVDSGSNPAEAAEVARIVGETPGFRLIRVDEPGLSLARNVALEKLSGEWMALLDDDATPAADWTQQAIRLLDLLPQDCVALGGYVRPVVPEGAMQPRGRRWRQLISAVEFPGEGDCTDDIHVVAANLWFRADRLRAVGGFPTSLGRVGTSLLSGEDKLVVGRLLAQGGRIWYSERMQVDHKVHRERLARPWAITRAYWDGISDRRIAGILAQSVGARQTAVIGMKLLLVALFYFVPSTSEEFFLRFWYDLGWLKEDVHWMMSKGVQFAYEVNAHGSIDTLGGGPGLNTGASS